MKSASIGLGLLALGCPALPAGPANLKDIDRAIAKEPKYAP